MPPGSSNGIKKIETITEIYQNIRSNKHTKSVIVGDWNTPQSELEDGTIQTWARKGSSKQSDYWDKGERLLLEQTKELGYYDVFRKIHGYKHEDYSWVTHTGTKRRYDHIYATSDFNFLTCRYLHTWREEKLSDHSPIYAELE